MKVLKFNQKLIHKQSVNLHMKWNMLLTLLFCPLSTLKNGNSMSKQKFS